jgi:hypothetical protein
MLGYCLHCWFLGLFEHGSSILNIVPIFIGWRGHVLDFFSLPVNSFSVFRWGKCHFEPKHDAIIVSHDARTHQYIIHKMRGHPGPTVPVSCIHFLSASDLLLVGGRL